MIGSFSPTAVYFNQFPTTGAAASVLGPEWEIYNSPGNAGFGVRSPGQIAVVSEATSTSGGNVLQITAQNVGGQHYSGGLKLRVPQLYGQYELRVRVADDASQVTSGVVLMWPQSNQWPRDGEINWWETFDFRNTRTPVKSYVHRLNPAATPPFDASDDQIVVELAHTGVDQSDWHKIVCSWAPDEIAIEIDNGPKVLITDNRDWIPGQPMELTLQLDAWSATPPASPVIMQVDYVLVREWIAPVVSTAFPAGRLDTRVEMAFGATGAPTGWTWTDVTPRLLAQSLQLQRGAPDEAGSIQPASVSLTLDNLDGALMPGNTASPWHPNVRRGTPLRISVDGDLPALVLDGSPGAFASTPHTAALNVTGDLDLRMLVQPDMWAPGVEWANTGGRILLGNTMRLASKWDTTGDQRSWIWHHFGAGWPAIEWASLGTAASTVVDGSQSVVGDIRPIWLAVTVDVNNGASGTTITYYTWDYGTPAPASLAAWNEVGQSVRAGTTTIHASTAPLRVGGIAAGLATMRGRVLRFELRNGINGTVLANPNFSAQAPGTTSFVDGAGRTWTLNGTATISTRRHRFVGEVVSIEPTWPHGDNHPTTSATRPSESWVHITAADVVRRLRQGAQPLRSPLRRHVTSARFASKVTAYWSCEDERDAVQFGSAVPGGSPLAITGTIELATANTLPASDALPAVAAGDSCTLTSTVTGGPTTRWAMEWVAKFGAPGTTTNVLRWLCAASAATEWRVQLVPGTPDMRLQVLNGGGSILFTDTFSISAYTGKWLTVRVDARQDGAAIAWELRVVDIDAGTGFTRTGSLAATTLNRVSSINSTMTGTADGLTVGHITLHDGLLPASPSWLLGADTAWIGETAAHRIWRLCTEEGVPIEVVQDYTVWSSPRGALAFSEPMGPQGRKPLVDLLAEAAQLDMGILTTRRSAPGLVYRPGTSLYDQVPALELDGTLNQITRPLVGRLDDQLLANDVTVRSVNGSSARAVDAASVTAAGRYAADVELNAIGGLKVQAAILSGSSGLATAVANQLADQAARRLLLGTVTSLRWPTVTIDLSVAPELIGAVLNLEPGDRVTLTGLPVQAPAGVIELQVRNIVDRMTPTRWLVELTAVPGSPWIT